MKNIILLKHQLSAFKKYKKLKKKKKNGMLIFHSVGSGKTITILNILNSIFKNVNHIYVVCPPYINLSWISDIEKLNLKTLFKKIIFINIGNLEEILQVKRGNIIIVDESHHLTKLYFKNKKSPINVSIQLIQIFRDTFFTFFLSATPIIDDISDFFLIENILNESTQYSLPQSSLELYPEYYTCKNYYQVLLFNKILPKIEKFTTKFPYYIILGLVILLMDFYNYTQNDPPNLKTKILIFLILSVLSYLHHLNRIHYQYSIVDYNYVKIINKLKCIHTYMRPDLHKDFPQKIFKTIVYELNYKQTKNIVLSIFWNINTYNKKYISKGKFFKGVNLTDKNLLSFSNLSNSKKWLYVINIIKEHKNRIVITTRYDKNGMEIIQGKLKKKKIQYVTLYPQLNSEEMAQIINDFNEGKINVLLLHPEIIEGITLKNTKALIMIDVCYERIIREQIIGRVIRYKSHEFSTYKEVYIYDLISTFNENIFDQVLNEFIPSFENSEYFKLNAEKFKFLVKKQTPDEYFFERSQKIEVLYDHIKKINKV
jgi:superfamily II DNA or RNA helicase